MPSNTCPRRAAPTAPGPTARPRRAAAARCGTSSVGEQLAGREDPCLVELVGRALVVDGEAREAVDLVTPEVDAHRVVVGRREDVDDRPAHRRPHRALDLVLAAVAELDELSGEDVGVDDPAGPDRDRLDGGGLRPEALQHGTDGGDDDRWAALGIAQAPQDFEPATHGFDRRADPLERECLPGREEGHVAGWEELLEVLGQLAGHRPGRRDDDERAAAREVGQRGDRDRAGHLDDGQAGGGVAEGARQRWFVAQQWGECSQAHGTVQGTDGFGRRPGRRARTIWARTFSNDDLGARSRIREPPRPE